MNTIRNTVLAACLLVLPGLAPAASFTGTDYTAAELLLPCQEADNDARWGAAAEAECEQYILGFVDAMAELGMTGKKGKVACPPPVNTADEVRWAYMRWVHADYAKRTVMPAADALLAMLKDTFPCT
jgi:hypothetical protein